MSTRGIETVQPLASPPRKAYEHVPASTGGASLVTILVCVLSSLLPAYRAARLDPAVALRYE